MHRLENFLAGLDHRSRGVLRYLADAVAEDRKAENFVDRHPVLDPVAQGTDRRRAVIGKVLGDLPAPPRAVTIFQCLGAVPVEQSGVRRDAVLQQGVGQASVEVQALLVHRAPAVGNHPRPGDAEAIVLDAQLGQQLYVIFEAMVMVAGHVARIAIRRSARRVAEGIPDARLAAIIGGRAFDLVGSRGRTPPEVGRKIRRIGGALALEPRPRGLRRHGRLARGLQCHSCGA